MARRVLGDVELRAVSGGSDPPALWNPPAFNPGDPGGWALAAISGGAGFAISVGMWAIEQF